MNIIAINWANVGLQAGQLLLALSILVILHEFGHYITAKWFKCRVEKFFLFFDPWFALFKKKVGDTVYGIGWLPLGGYVKISGMIDESMDKEAMKQPPQEWEFRSKPAWQRLIVMLGGVIMNILVWTEKWEALANELKPVPGDLFVFANTITFPRQAAHNLETTYETLKKENKQ